MFSFGQYIIYVLWIQFEYVIYNNKIKKQRKNIVYIIYTFKLNFIMIKNRSKLEGNREYGYQI